MTELNELKHCPFCGGKAEFGNVTEFVEKDVPYFGISGFGALTRKEKQKKEYCVVRCVKCNCVMRYHDKNSAIKAWNRRADNEIS